MDNCGCWGRIEFDYLILLVSRTYQNAGWKWDSVAGLA